MASRPPLHMTNMDMTIDYSFPKARPRQTKTLTTVVPTIRVRNRRTGCRRLAHWHKTSQTIRANESLEKATSCPSGWPTIIERSRGTSHILKRNKNDYCTVDNHAEAGNSSIPTRRTVHAYSKIQIDQKRKAYYSEGQAGMLAGNWHSEGGAKRIQRSSSSCCSNS